MNVALIFAGGVGKRMSSSGSPKQFLHVYGRPIIIHTLSHFEEHEEIDAIVVVCLSSHISVLEKKLKHYHISKVTSVVPGGDTGQESIYIGLNEIRRYYSEDTIVLIHDGVRPIIDQNLISRNIDCARRHGNAISVCPSSETIARSDANDTISTVMERSSCLVAKAPQTFVLGDILSAHKSAHEQRQSDFVDSASMMIYFGHKLHYVSTSPSNIKITTPSDYYIFKALLNEDEAEKVMGL